MWRWTVSYVNIGVAWKCQSIGPQWIMEASGIHGQPPMKSLLHMPYPCFEKSTCLQPHRLSSECPYFFKKLKELLCFEWSPPWHFLWQSLWHSVQHIFWQSFWHIFWHSIWHIFWHSIQHICWRSIRLALFHIFSHSIWPIFWQSFWHSIWHIFWRSLWNVFWHCFRHIFW